MKCLIVIDMQEDYVGSSRNQSRYSYKVDTLIDNINKKISEYQPNNVMYVVNRLFWEWHTSEKKIVSGLSIVSTHIFEKRSANCFTPELIDTLQALEVTEIELVGVDGNYCVRASALAGKENCFNIRVDTSCIGVRNISAHKSIIRNIFYLGLN